MKLHIPKDWLHGVSAKDEVEPLAGAPPDLDALRGELALGEKMLPGLLAYRRQITTKGWVEEISQRDDEAFQNQVVALLQRYPQRSPALLRGSVVTEIGDKASDPRLAAWLSYLNTKSLVAKISANYEGLNLRALEHVAALSTASDGPLKAIEFLRERGLLVFIERAIPGTKVDGCAFWSLADRPVIGLSVRFDRLDNFWFSLLHECAHVALHIKGPQDAFADDLYSASEGDELEVEANQAAADAAIPRATWKRSNALRWPTPANIGALASEVGIHPSIVAGRVRFEKKNYTLFSDLLGHGEVSRIFRLEKETS